MTIPSLLTQCAMRAGIALASLCGALIMLAVVPSALMVSMIAGAILSTAILVGQRPQAPRPALAPARTRALRRR